MGDFRLEMTATGGHGCQREKKSGEPVVGCRRLDCPDCVLVEFVSSFHRKFPVKAARLVHWPGQPTEVVDEITVGEFGYASRVRRGNF